MKCVHKHLYQLVIRRYSAYYLVPCLLMYQLKEYAWCAQHKILWCLKHLQHTARCENGVKTVEIYQAAWIYPQTEVVWRRSVNSVSVNFLVWFQTCAETKRCSAPWHGRTKYNAISHSVVERSLASSEVTFLENLEPARTSFGNTNALWGIRG